MGINRVDARLTELGEGLVLLSVPAEGSSARLEALTKAEREVVKLVVNGLADEAVARARGIAASTVSKQLVSIYRKLGVSGRRELKAYLRGASWQDPGT